MRARLIVLALALVMLVGGGFAVVSFATRSLPGPDVAAVNDLLARTESGWGELTDDSYPPDAPSLTVVDVSGAVVYSRGDLIENELAAVRERARSLTVEVGGEPVGQLFVASTDTQVYEAQTRMLVGIIASVLAGAAILLIRVFVWIERRILWPFRRLREFAAHVADGDLGVPLEMDRGNHFGAFTEAFDLMRTELAAARRAERKARADKQDLIAQLSHDIRTPVATIGATAELLELGESDHDRAAKLRLVVEKTRQIDELMSTLFQANADEIEQLPITPETISSEELATIIRAADVNQLLREFTLPDALVDVDPRRLAQVLDNVFANTSKYAGTVMRLERDIEGEHLALRLRDFGPGVPAHEHPVLVGKGVRGSNAADVPGFGLGLYTAARLMERMGGSLATRPAEGGGFEVDLALPLSR
ncbi:HAMP domain-containing sensor histidine kinase [Gulosibacter molinativorax]|uniref:histidine kinase n=1 Tax=Gulosibacter molinativorax TaxID=256821 RepID=A0ABT7C5X9_9MICO|nr:HAMP domain-containing sensor histidine kinase [Gulosibacter molinativorax]MDJ1370595.1 sensor histidine kinase [Gulosibacter molinativorax]QUY61991.1 ATPase/histidine kinase/DNA gyrase B/HSP90 domain protein [Gulosibacter molinativorax]